MAQQAAPEDLPKRLPLVLEPENRSESLDKDAKLVNGYVEKNDQTGETWIYKRPGLDQTLTTIAGNGYGVYNWLGDIYRIQGATLYKNDVAIVGAVDTTNGVYRFSSCLGATPRLQLGNGVHAYNYDSGAGLVQIDGGGNVNFPTPFRKGWAYLDGTTYVLAPDATVRGCDDLNTPEDWTDLLNTITAQIEPDRGVALAKQLVYAIVFKQWTTEVFYDAQFATGSPLGPVQGAKIDYGCINQDSVQEIDGKLIWAATNRSAAVQVVILDNLKATPISTKPVERILGEADLSSVLSFGFKWEGHRFYGLTLKNNNITLVYDLTDKHWAQWTDTNGDYFPIVSTTFAAGEAQILQHETNGKLYLMDALYYTDDGEGITVDLYTPNFDGGTARKKMLGNMWFIGDQTAGSVLQVRNNDNDYDPRKWSNFRQVDMGQQRPSLVNNGTFRRRAYHMRHQCNTPLRLQAIELQLALGTL